MKRKMKKQRPSAGPERQRQFAEMAYSADMQKIMMLPVLDGLKSAVFTRRIIAFHETIASLGEKKKTDLQTFSAVWHEGPGGRSGAEVASTFIVALRHPTFANSKHLTLWLDNCTRYIMMKGDMMCDLSV